MGERKFNIRLGEYGDLPYTDPDAFKAMMEERGPVIIKEPEPARDISPQTPSDGPGGMG